jgi:hypothetical protein
MIYRSSYFNKELRQVYFENRESNRRKLALALFLGLISFALYFALQPLKESVLYEILPVIMQPGYYSTLSIYIHVALAAITLYYMIYYNSLFFHEITRNSWYLLVKMGYNPALMIFSKLAALFLSTFFVYSTGFVFTAFLTYFLKYTFVWSYLPSLYLAGLLDLLFISIGAATLSPFIRTLTNARYLIFFSLLLLIFLKIKLGYYTTLTNRVAMQNPANLFDPGRSSFFHIVAVAALLSALVCILKAGNLSRYYSLPHGGYDHSLLPERPVVVIDLKTGRRKAVDNRDRFARRSKLFDAVFTSFLIFFIIAVLSFNIIILLINASTIGKEVSFGGVIPYIFKSETMEPSIMLNDLAYFKVIDGEQAIEVEQIILFEDSDQVYVERVTAKNGELYEVDIDHYPPATQPGAMIKEVERERILGVYSGRSRWLGALILFANTIFGRIIFLLIPAVLLFYHRPLTRRLFRGTVQG